MSNFLDVDDSLIAKNLLLPNSLPSQQENDLGFPGGLNKGPQILTPSERREQAHCKFIIPHPGMCIKTREKITGQKVFLNLCTSSDVPEPDEYFTDEQMSRVLSDGADEELNAIRLPMSIGEKHMEKDKQGKGCPVFDVVINTALFENKIVKSELYRTFMIIVTIEAIEEKFQVDLEKDDYIIMSHKKSIGKLNPHFVKSKPGIKELTGGKNSIQSSSLSTKKPLVEEIDTKESHLDCNITQMSSELARAEIKIPNLRNTKKLSVIIGADRILVDTPVGSLDVFVPVDIHQEESRAEFNMDTEVLTLHLPLVVKP